MGTRYTEEQILTIYKELGIDPASFPDYQGAEEFGRSINHGQASFVQKLSLTDRTVLTASKYLNNFSIDAKLE